MTHDQLHSQDMQERAALVYMTEYTKGNAVMKEESQTNYTSGSDSAVIIFYHFL